MTCASARAVSARAGEPVGGLGELWVGVPPDLAGVGGERDVSRRRGRA